MAAAASSGSIPSTVILSYLRYLTIICASRQRLHLHKTLHYPGAVDSVVPAAATIFCALTAVRSREVCVCVRVCARARARFLCAYRCKVRQNVIIISALAFKTKPYCVRQCNGQW